MPQHTKNRDDGEISGSNGHRLIGLLVGALSAATVLAGASLAFVMVRRRRMIRQVSRQSQSASFQECIADKPHLPPAIHLTVSPYTQITELLHMTLKKTITPYLYKIFSLIDYLISRSDFKCLTWCTDILLGTLSWSSNSIKTFNLPGSKIKIKVYWLLFF